MKGNMLICLVACTMNVVSASTEESLLQDSLFTDCRDQTMLSEHWEYKNSAFELVLIYEIYYKDMLIRKQAADLYRKNIELIYVSCALFLSLGLGWWKQLKEVKYGVYTQKKRKGSGETAKLRMNAVEKDKSETDRRSTKEKRSASAINDQSLFNRMEHEIISRQLFLHADFSREELIKIVYVPKNKFARLFETYAKMKFPEYINNLRLIHAAKLLKERPEYTIATIARECGMSPPTFYRLFATKFGTTPTEYQRRAQQSENENFNA